MEIQIDYINYERGGRPNANYSGDGGLPDPTGLVRIMLSGSWPAILGVGEAERWEFNGYQGAYEAAVALRRAGGPPYVPFVGSLPREGGPFGPAILVDPTAVEVHRWYDHRLGDFGSRNRNLLVCSIPGRSEVFRVLITHGDIHDGNQRLADAMTFDRFADPEIPCVILGDWNSTLSGPMWEVGDWNNPDPMMHQPHRRAHKIMFLHGPRQAGPHVADTRALDYLCGFWTPGRRLWLRRRPARRVGGIGFYDVAELEGDYTPTQYPHPFGRPPRTIDRALVNRPLRDAYVRGSYRVHDPLDPSCPDSDHKRISFVLDM
ncbi:hypothetical protein [Actinomadura miaoliensis]|uniref:Endonuclease/exonuclease/phosphatase family protein n=1 Tax=Actinomadura miaoliensis TaxID=430685 RepID=A0ABP7W7A7_9ACTN